MGTLLLIGVIGDTAMQHSLLPSTNRQVQDVLSWVKGNPLALFEGKPPGYRRVQKTLLVIGLALREIDRVLFTDEDDSMKYPDYVRNSPFMLSDWEKAVEGCNQLLQAVGLKKPIPEPDGNEIAEPSASQYVFSE